MVRLEMILIITPHDDGANVFRVTLFVHPILTEDNVFEHASAEIPQWERWQVETGIPVLLSWVMLELNYLHSVKLTCKGHFRLGGSLKPDGKGKTDR